MSETLPIALEHEEVGQEMVGQKHRLRSLEVGVAGHDQRPSRFRLLQKSAHEFHQPLLVSGDRRPQIEVQIESHLVVAAAPGVNFPGHRARDLGQSPLDGHVDILVLEPPREDALPDLLRDLGQRAPVARLPRAR